MTSPSLRRDLGPLASYATIVGVLIGAGIFRVTGEAGGVAGSSVPFAYLLLAPVVLALATAYAVFSSTPLGGEAGGDYLHISRTFRSYYAGFVAMWMKLVAFVGAISFLSLSFGGYMNYFLPGLDSRAWAVAALLAFYGINLRGVRYYGAIQTAMLVVLIASIILLIVPGLFAVKPSHFVPLLPKGVSGLFTAMPMLFFSFAGFETLAQTGAETRDPADTLPKVFFRGILLASAIYFLMSFVAFGVLPADELARSESAMADAAAVYLPPWGAAVVAVGAICAFLTSINASILVPSRMFYVFGEDRLMPRALSSVHPDWRTPHVSLLVSAAISVALVWTQGAAFLLNTGLIGVFIMYAMESAALVMLPKVNRPLYDSARIPLSPTVLALVGGFSIVAMAAFIVATLPKVWIWTLVWWGVGSALYLLGRREGRKEGFDYAGRLQEWKGK